MNSNQKFSVKFYRGSIKFIKWLALAVLTVVTLVFLLEITLAVITSIMGTNTTIASAIIETSILTALAFALVTRWNVYRLWEKFFKRVFNRFNTVQLKRAAAKADKKSKNAAKQN